MPVKSRDTLGGRVANLMATKGIASARALGLAMQAKGYEVSRATLSNIIADRVDTPRAENIRALAEFFEVPEDDLYHGPRSGEAFFLSELKGIQDHLTEYQRDQLLYLANSMAAETKRIREDEARRAAVTDDELSLLEQLRQAPPGTLDALLAQVQAATGNTAEKSPGRPRTPRAPRR
jgi:transcriptional regulator with XRE-family HTH domain